jgi:hypothetical protein
MVYKPKHNFPYDYAGQLQELKLIINTVDIISIKTKHFTHYKCNKQCSVILDSLFFLRRVLLTAYHSDARSNT